MRTVPFLVTFLSAGTALGLSGCVEPTPEPEPQSFATSFDVTANLRFAPPDSELPGLPGTQSLHLRLDDAADGDVAAILASSNGSTPATFVRSSTGLVLRRSVELSITPAGIGYFDTLLSIDHLELVVVDSDGDGSVDTVEGRGDGALSQFASDVWQLLSFELEMRGSRDESAPYLSLSVTDRVHVLDGLTILPSEPLEPVTTASIRVGSTSIPLETHPLGAPYVTELRTSAILPFDTEVGVRIEPEPRDLAGFGIEYGLERILTMPDPGLFAEDGFEGELAAVSSGVEVVTGFGTLPALSGTRSLLVAESWGKVTMRVPLEEGDTHLRFEARLLFDRSFGFTCPAHGLRVGFPALAKVEPIYPSWTMFRQDETGDERWTAATPVTTVELPLPEGAGSELIFDIFQPAPTAGVPCLETGMLIDDLHAE